MLYLVNRHFETDRRDDLERTVKWELKAAERSPMDEMRSHLPLRIRARMDFMAGRRDAAIAKLTKLVELEGQKGPRAQTPRDEYALALMIGGDAGAIAAARADERMRSVGYHDPLQEVFAAYPELRQAAIR